MIAAAVPWAVLAALVSVIVFPAIAGVREYRASMARTVATWGRTVSRITAREDARAAAALEALAAGILALVALGSLVVVLSVAAFVGGVYRAVAGL